MSCSMYLQRHQITRKAAVVAKAINHAEGRHYAVLFGEEQHRRDHVAYTFHPVPKLVKSGHVTLAMPIWGNLLSAG